MIRHLFPLLFIITTVSYAQKVPHAMFQNGATHCGVYPSAKSFESLGELKWKFKSGGKIFSSPAVLNGVAFVGSEDHNLYAVNTKTGKVTWVFKTGGAVNSSPAVYRGIVYFGSFDGCYYAVNAKTGKQLWKFKTGGEKHPGAKGLWGMTPKDLYMDDQYDFYLSSPVLNFDDHHLTIYFGSGDSNLYALDAHTGKKKWSYKTNGVIHNSPALSNNTLYFGSWDTYFYAVDAMNGHLKWKFKTGDQPVYHLMEGIQSSPTCYDGSVYFGSRDGNFYSLNASTGKMLWKTDLKGSWMITTASAKDGLVYISTSDTYLFMALDAKTGAERFRFKANGYIYSSAAISGNTAYFGDFTGNLFALNLKTGKLANKFNTPGRTENGDKLLNKDNLDFIYLVRSKDTAAYSTSLAVMDQFYKLGPIVSSPSIANGVIYFGSADGYLYALNLK